MRIQLAIIAHSAYADSTPPRTRFVLLALRSGANRYRIARSCGIMSDALRFLLPLVLAPRAAKSEYRLADPCGVLYQFIEPTLATVEASAIETCRARPSLEWDGIEWTVGASEDTYSLPQAALEGLAMAATVAEVFADLGLQGMEPSHGSLPSKARMAGLPLPWWAR